MISYFLNMNDFEEEKKMSHTHTCVKIKWITSLQKWDYLYTRNFHKWTQKKHVQSISHVHSEHFPDFMLLWFQIRVYSCKHIKYLLLFSSLASEWKSWIFGKHHLRYFLITLYNHTTNFKDLNFQWKSFTPQKHKLHLYFSDSGHSVSI